MGRTLREANLAMITKILVPIDGSDLTQKVLNTACDIATKHNAPVYLIHVFSVTHLTALSSRSEDEPALESLIEDAEEAAVKIVREAERFAKAKDVEVAQTFVTEGDAADEILRFARKKRIDTIVIGSHGTGGVLAVPLGSVCDKVCHSCECACIIVK
jgi:nucleotide-binding universal stress UspA family protein